MTDGEDARRGVRRAALGAGLLAMLVFAPSIVNGFAYDDLPIIEQNPLLHDLADLPELLASPYWPGPLGRELGVWRPLTSGSLALLWSVADGSPWPFHLANILLHGAVSALVALLAGGLVGVAGGWIAGILFAVHPVHVEAVANGIGLGELLAGGWVVAACLVLVRSRPGEPLGIRRSALILTCFALGLLAKEGAAVLPALLVILDAGRERLRLRDLGPWLRRRWGLYAGLVAMMAGIFLVRLQLLGSVASTRPPLGAEPLAEIPRIWTAAEAWLEYVRLMVWPVRLLPDYAPAVIPLRYGWDGRGILGATLVLAILALAWLLARRAPGDEGPRRLSRHAVPLGILWFSFAVLPVSNLFFLGGVLVAERTLYLPSVGFVLAVAGPLGAFMASRRGRAFRVPALAVVGLLILRSITYIPVWTNQRSVFGYLAEAAPESGRAQWYLGDRFVEAGAMEPAKVVYRRAIPILGVSESFMGGAGGRLMAGGELEWAEIFLRRAFELDPSRPNAPRLLAVITSRREHWEEAETWARRSLENDSSALEVWHLLANTLEEQGRWGEAVRAREGLLERGERHVWQQWYWLARDRHLAGSPGAVSALDSARLRAKVPEALQRIDSLSVVVSGDPGPL